MFPLAQKSDAAYRLLDQEPHEYRTHFARDRDRIIYSNAFKRLIHKTQVYAATDPSKFTTRLTHTLKVMQIAQTISRALTLNEDLSTAIALGHDIGHPPFGHVGEDALRQLMMDIGGFEHNEESVWFLMNFEKLNLTFQTLEGILKHTGFDFTPYKKSGVKRKDPFAEFDLPDAARTFTNIFKYGSQEGPDGKLQFEKPSTLEGQVVDISDEIAYVAHDLVDLRNAGTITTTDIPDWWIKKFGKERKQESNTINKLVTGVIDSFAKQIMGSTYVDPSTKTIVHPDDLNKMVNDIKDWYSNIFKSKFAKTKNEAETIINYLFSYFLKNEDKMPGYCVYYDVIKGDGYNGKELVGHCIATMTDIEAKNTYKKIK